jgi:hypothetical protein
MAGSADSETLVTLADPPRGDAVRGPLRRSLAAAAEGRWTNLWIALVLAALSWPVALVSTPSDLDASWEAALYLAVQRHLHFGSDIVFTYGPLGFATIPWPWFGPLTLVALAIAAGLQVAICAVAIQGARRVLPFVPAVVVAYVAARLFTAFRPPEAMLAVAVALSLAALLRRDAAPWGRLPWWWLAIAAGVIGSLAALGKISDGVFVAGTLAITAVGLAGPRVKAAGLVIVGAVAGFLVAWLVTGQGLGDIVGFVRGSVEIVRGYSEAMAAPGAANEWYIVAYLAGVAIVAWWSWPAAASLPLGRRIAVVLVGALAAFAFFKIGVVRWGVGYALGAVLLVAFATAQRPRGAAVFVLGSAVLCLPLLAVSGESPASLLSPLRSLGWLGTEAGTVVQPWTWAAEEARTAADFRTLMGVDPGLIAGLNGETVSIDPWDTGVIVGWPDLTWRPVPVFQSYSAYTPYLDQLNATVLAGPDAPTRILRRSRPGPATPLAGPPTIDQRDGWFEAPEAMLQTFCRYDEVAAAADWEVLGLTSRRCGTEQSIGTVVARTGQAVAVPPSPDPNDIVIVRILGIGTLRDALLTAAVKAPIWRIALDGKAPYRLVPGTAGDGLLLAVPSTVRRSLTFAFGPPRTSMIVSRADGASQALTFEFVAIPLVAP